MTAGFMRSHQEKPAVIDRRYSGVTGRHYTGALCPSLLYHLHGCLHDLIRRCDQLCISLIAALECENFSELGCQVDIGLFERTADETATAALARRTDKA